MSALDFYTIEASFKGVLPIIILSAIFIFVAYQIIKAGMELMRRTSASIHIQTVLSSVVTKTEAERITVMIFHVPNPRLAVIPFDFMSCKYEAYKDGKQPVSHILNQVPTTLFINFLDRLRQGYMIMDTEKPNPAVTKVGYELVIAEGESKALCAMLYAMDNKPIGYVSLKKNVDFTEKDIELILAAAKELSSLLESRKGKKIS